MVTLPYPKIHFPFFLPKGIAMVQYLLNEVGGEYNYMGLLKLAFFADRYHVRKHARPISMDDYYAFPYGPGGSTLKDILLEPEVVFFETVSPIEKSSKYFVKLRSKDIDISQFSKSDLEAMKFAVDNFSDIGKRFGGELILSDISHAYPEWDRYADLFGSGKTKRESMYYEDFLNNSNPEHPMFLKHNFVDPFVRLSEDNRNDLLEEMLEDSICLSA